MENMGNPWNIYKIVGTLDITGKINERHEKNRGKELQGGAPPSYKLVYNPINYRYIYHKS